MSNETGIPISAFYLPTKRVFKEGDTFTWLSNDGETADGRKLNCECFKVNDLVCCRVIGSEKVIRFLREELADRFVQNYVSKPVGGK